MMIKRKADMQRAQEELKNSEVTGSAAGGLVETGILK